MKGEKSCKQAKGRVFNNVPKNLNNKASWLNSIFFEILFEERDDSHLSATDSSIGTKDT